MWLREAGQPPLYHLWAALFVAPLDTSDFPDFVRFNIAHPAVTQGSLSEATNVFIHTGYEAFPYRGSVLAVHLVRLFTLLWGAGAVVGTYWTACEIVPRSPSLALGAAAVAAFNPHFLLISSVINNDATAACLCTWTLWAAVRLVKGESGRPGRARSRYGSALVLGLLLGLSLLSKLSALALLPLAALALWLAWWRERDLRSALLQGALVYGAALVVAGWWFVRNWLVYGDLTGLSAMLAAYGGRDGWPAHLVLPELVGTFRSYWASFACELAFPDFVYWGFGALTIVAAAGWVPGWRDAKRKEREAALLLLGWLVLVLASWVRWNQITYAPLGRLFFQAGVAIGALLGYGLETFFDGLLGWMIGYVTLAWFGEIPKEEREEYADYIKEWKKGFEEVT